MLTWHPLICPTGACVVELEKRPDRSTNWDAPKGIINLCPHHANVKAANALDNLGMFRAFVQTWRVKEAARAAVKAELGLDKNHPGVGERINSDGSITVLTTAAALAWRTDDDQQGPLPSINNAARARARTRAATAMAAVEKPAGTANVTVE